jgi:hypothetical protein
LTSDIEGGLPEKRYEPRLVICEGHSDSNLLAALLREHHLSGAQIHVAKGRDNFTPPLRGARVQGYKAVLVVSDNDDNPQASFDAVCTHLRSANYPVPAAPREMVTSAGNPSISILMIPWDGTQGAIETLCLPALEETYANKVACLDEFCRCTGVDPHWSATRRSEMRAECLLACTQTSEPKLGLGHFVSRGNCPLNFRHHCFENVTEALRQFVSVPV